MELESTQRQKRASKMKEGRDKETNRGVNVSSCSWLKEMGMQDVH